RPPRRHERRPAPTAAGAPSSPNPPPPCVAPRTNVPNTSIGGGGPSFPLRRCTVIRRKVAPEVVRGRPAGPAFRPSCGGGGAVDAAGRVDGIAQLRAGGHPREAVQRDLT